ncbi:MAG: hypothetical protein K0R15_2954, partial [Clostridiales bacterium]|nr:hypothetical protein [Clostridiales bacterium]
MSIISLQRLKHRKRNIRAGDCSFSLRECLAKEKTMIWSKMKQQLESFLCPALVGRVEYRASSYRY